MKKAALVIVFLGATLGLIFGLGLVVSAFVSSPPEAVTADLKQICREAVGWGWISYLTQADGETLLRLVNCGNHDIRRGAIYILGERGVVRAVGPIIKCLQSRDHRTRRNAVRALGKIGQASAVNPLIKTMNNRFELSSIRCCAAWALGGIPDCGSVTALRGISSKGQGDLKTTSQVALQHLHQRCYQNMLKKGEKP